MKFEQQLYLSKTVPMCIKFDTTFQLHLELSAGLNIGLSLLYSVIRYCERRAIEL